MAKVMLVEDDNNLREIYEARLAAEGYEIVAAQDGEEALALAVKERPDLIIADIMMPKVSGFDMLDILRSTPETKHSKIIMMTALSQAEDKTRAETLGADRYLVKSQVTLEDVVKVAAEMLADASGTVPAAVASAVAEPTTVQTTPAVATDSTDDSTPAEPASSSSTPPVPEPSEPSVATTPGPAAAPPSPVVDEPTTAPVKDDTTGEPEEKKDEVTADEAKASEQGEPVAKEEAQVTEQIDDFIKSNPTLSTSAEPQSAEPTTAPVTPAEEPAFKEEVITPPAAPTKTSIPVTVAQEEPEATAPEAETPAPATEQATTATPSTTEPATKETSEPQSDADETLNRAVDSLVNDKAPSESSSDDNSTPPEEKKEDSAEPEDDSPKLAKKRGGERVIEPLSDPSNAQPDLEALLAKENDTNGITPPTVNTVIAPGGAVTTPSTAAATSDQPAFTDGNHQPGTVVQAPNDDPSKPAESAGDTPPSNPNNIAL